LTKAITPYLKIFLFVAFCFNLSRAEVFPVTDIMVNGSPDSRVNIVFLGDGYTTQEMGNYIDDVEEVVEGLFNTVPYSNYVNHFNVFAIEVPSNESGTDHPGTASDCGGESNNVFYADTYFDSSFDLYGIHRLLYIQNTSAAFDVLIDNVPNWDIAFVMVNTTMYGGAGGNFAVFSRAESSTEIAIHEIGHSFVGLSDEYWAGFQYAYENTNMTQDSNPTTVRWEPWMYENGVGIYPYESPGSDWHRPHQNCKMRYLGPPFCSICSEHTVKTIHSTVNMIENYYPIDNSIFIEADGVEFFSVTPILNTPNYISIGWYFNGEQISQSSSIELDALMYSGGQHQLKVVVEDFTDLVRNDSSNILKSEIVWNVEIEDFLVGDLNFDGVINILDVILAISLVLENEYSSSADINFDGTVDVVDIVQLVNIVINY